MDAVEVAAGSVLPENHEDQLQLGFRLIQNSYNNKMASLEQEVRGLRLTVDEQKTQGAALQRKNSALEVELVEGHQRAQQLADENKELFKTVQGLRRQLSRLEGLRKSVMDSIADHQQAECETVDTKHYMRDDYLKEAMPLTLASLHHEAAALPAPGYSRPASPPPSRQDVPAAPPAPHPAAGVGGFGGDDAQPVDGKQFFRKARSSLSYGAFNDFLASIKRLNNQQQTREETLEQARRLFGAEQQGLYDEFEQLLNKHASPM